MKFSPPASALLGLLLGSKPNHHHVHAATAATGNAICPSCSPNLRSLYDDHMKATMPRSNTNAYVPPTSENLSDMETIVGEMMAGLGCASLDLRSLFGKYDVGFFTDTSVSRLYCVLVARSTEFAWSNVVVNESPTARALSIDTPHPLYDGTDEQTVAIFAGTNAKSMVLSGSHRKGSDLSSTCDGLMSDGTPYRISDGAHVVGGMQHAYKAIMDHYTALQVDYTAIQFHGMGSTRCGGLGHGVGGPGVDAYLTHGNSVVPRQNEKVDILRDAASVEFEDMLFTVPGDSPYCSLTGGTNTQGRMLNGVDLADACQVAATSYTGKFIHVESKGHLRNDSDEVHANWVNAVNAAYEAFPMADAPRSIALTSPNGGDGMLVGRGTIVPIAWVANGIDDTDEFQLSIGTMDEEGNYSYEKGIAWGSENNPYVQAAAGAYDWRVQTSLEPGDYVIRIRGVEETNVLDYSDAPFSIVKTFDVTYPNESGDTVAWGDPVTLTWNTNVANDAAGIGTIKLALCKGPDKDFYQEIVAGVDNTGSFQLAVPGSVAPGDDYTIRVWNEEWISSVDYSDHFFAVTGGSITVTKPNGGEIIGQGTNVPVEWTKTGAIADDDDLQISVGRMESDGITYDYMMGLAYSSNPSSAYHFATASAGKFDWTVRTALAEGSYVLRIRSQSNQAIKDYSDTEFSVVNPLAITFPNGGQTFEVGETITITWDIRAPGVDTVKLSLHKGSSKSYYKLIGDSQPNTGSYTWTIPTSYERRSDYTIRIRNVDYTASKDYSDSYIEIVDAGASGRSLRRG